MNIATAQKQPPGAFCEKVVLQNSQKNICVIVSFLREKNDSGTGVFLWIRRNIYEHFFLQNEFEHLLLTAGTWQISIFSMAFT